MIAIQIQDENGQTDAEFEDAQVLDALAAQDLTETKCLRFIDPYGDTTFNRGQALVLADEIEAAASRLPDIANRKRLIALAQFAQQVGESVHTYLKFIGE